VEVFFCVAHSFCTLKLIITFSQSSADLKEKLNLS
jgi:hypothetical protein